MHLPFILRLTKVMRMNKAFVFAAILCLAGAVSCLKNNSNNTPTIDCSSPTTAAPASETAVLKRYLDSSATFAVQDTRGFFYVMDSTVADSVSGHPTICSGIAVTYKGALLNGTAIDSSNSAITIPLSNVIVGWQEMLPLMRKNATVKLYLPPSLAYGSVGSSTAIPPNAYLVFTIKLYDFN